MQLFYEDKKLLETMTVIIPGFGQTKIVLSQGSESLTFLLNFEKVEGKELKAASEPVDAHTLKITLTNWENVLGTGLLEPLEVGTFGKRRLYLYLFVRRIGTKGSQKVATLSFYTGQEVPDG